MTEGCKNSWHITSYECMQLQQFEMPLLTATLVRERRTMYKHSYMIRTEESSVMVDWYCGYRATTPSHLGRKLAGPLCTAFSSARRPQRHSTSSDMRALWQRGTEMGEKWPTNLAGKADFHVISRGL